MLTTSQDHPRAGGDHLAVQLQRPPHGGHPRAGGDHLTYSTKFLSNPGSPPRWRGPPPPAVLWCSSMGITPALAGTTLPGSPTRSIRPDHPRAGGDHFSSSASPESSPGSPPRWRGPPLASQVEKVQVGITPALAGTTIGPPATSRCRADHPRAGGDHVVSESCPAVNCGSPPRWRGPRRSRIRPRSPSGITPALAGTTATATEITAATRDHPRAGGDHDDDVAARAVWVGSPPRWRGPRGVCHGGCFHCGITPALAGTTHTPSRTRRRSRDHPRAGGDHGFVGGLRVGGSGSPPRWRGPRASPARRPRTRRITPALAGTTLIVVGTPDWRTEIRRSPTQAMTLRRIPPLPLCPAPSPPARGLTPSSWWQLVSRCRLTKRSPDKGKAIDVNWLPVMVVDAKRYPLLAPRRMNHDGASRPRSTANPLPYFVSDSRREHPDVDTGRNLEEPPRQYTSQRFRYHGEDDHDHGESP